MQSIHVCIVNIMKTDQIQIKTHTQIIEPSLIGNVFRGTRIAQSSVFCVIFCRSLFLLLAVFLLDITLSGLLRFKILNYPFCIFKLFFLENMEFQQVWINTKSSERVAIVCHPLHTYKDLYTDEGSFCDLYVNG